VVIGSDGEEEDSRNSRLVSTKRSERCVEVLGVSKLLQIVCQRFCKIMKSLHEMIKKDVKWNWREKQILKELKKRFIMKLVLVIPDLDKKIRVDVDVLDFAMGRLLLMKCENDK